MSNNAITGVGAKFYRWNTEDSSAGFYNEQAEVNSITFDGLSRETIDVTDLKTAAANNGYRSKITGLRDSGTFSMNLNFTHDQYVQFKGDFEDGSNQVYLVVLDDPDSTYFEFEGLVTDLPLDIPLEDKVNSDVTIAIDGKVAVGTGGLTGAGSGSVGGSA